MPRIRVLRREGAAPIVHLRRPVGGDKSPIPLPVSHAAASHLALRHFPPAGTASPPRSLWRAPSAPQSALPSRVFLCAPDNDNGKGPRSSPRPLIASRLVSHYLSGATAAGSGLKSRLARSRTISASALCRSRSGVVGAPVSTVVPF